MTDLFAGINDGDTIRVEWTSNGKHQAVEGPWKPYSMPTSSGALGHVNVYSMELRFGGFDGTERVTVLQRALPPEPALGSVVLDSDCNPWKRNAIGWYTSGISGWEWSRLHAACGPVRVLWTPGDDK